ncbi:unnamed protein product [Adineta steineri]|uniref:Uncharacterized protein n=1 Tax=Adineta steineri TaxID=433720 RepID=A0A813NJX2_9BILA|nr:unnamed protein product [Adineta steineri]CAF0740740.1 unnamed protein product [Adineta steineri]CAF3782347.1 unnamed protein product [Adineta steineri]CAF3921131.1 unnamed protein product [Adineta steineri]CAF4161478.1 unnamed protein product [Adineta steineri]
MPFTVKDALHYKRSDRQKREIHEREYLNYISNLHQQQQKSYNSNLYYLSINHYKEIERSRLRNTVEKQNQFNRIYRENSLILDRLRKASQQPIVDNKNYIYEKNLEIFNTKRSQQRNHEYKRISDDNQVLLQRINNIQGNLITKEQCDRDWKRNVSIMKKTCSYPENIDRFITKSNKTEHHSCPYSKMNSTLSHKRHSTIKSPTEITAAPLALLLDES